MAILVQIYIFQTLRNALRDLENLRKNSANFAGLRRRHEIKRLFADNFMTIIAQYVLDFLIAESVSPGPIDLPDPVAGGFHKGKEPLAAVP